MQHDRFDVIVVGGGPAGITAATALGKAGFSVLVCEAAVYPGAENWSGAVYFTENLESEEAFGRQVVESAPYERRLVERGFFLYNGHSLLGAAMRDAGVFRSCYTVLRPVYDRYLAEVARQHGVVLLAETTVQSLIRHRGRVIGVHTERGPAYADVVFLAEGDASHLVTQEGYERVGRHAKGGAGRRGGEAGGAAAGNAEAVADDPGRGPHFLQGVKEVVSLPPEVLEERFGLPPGQGAAYEMLLRNGTRRGRTVRLNMGGFLYVNRDSLSLGFVLPIDNLAHHFDGDHNLLMEWFKGLPEVGRWIEGGEVTSYGAKIIRGGGLREVPRLVDDGLAIGGAASGIGLDFPYPNFTGPATAMGLLFARAVRQIAADAGTPRGGGSGGGGASPYTAAALEQAYVRPLERSHYYKNVERLADWPSYIERTQMFFERQVDVTNGLAWIVSRPDLGAARRAWEAIRLQRRVLPLKRLRGLFTDARDMSRGLRLGQAIGANLTLGTLGRWLLNTVTALAPGRRASTGGDEHTGLARAETPDGAQFRAIFRVMAGDEPAGRTPLLARWYWRRFGPALAAAFADVYTNDDEALDDKLPRAIGRLVRRLSIWDLLLGLVLGPAAALAWGLQAAIEWFQYFVLKKDLAAFREQTVSRWQEDVRRRLRLDDEAVEIATPYATKLGTISYREGRQSHIKVLWPGIGERGELARSPLWSVCPAKVYEVHRHPRGLPGVVVNYDNCVKCETCWRATDDVHWSRATRQRLIYETYTPAHRELRDYLLSRPEPTPRLRDGPGFWEEYWRELPSGRAAMVAPHAPGKTGGGPAAEAAASEPTPGAEAVADKCPAGSDAASLLAADIAASIESFAAGLGAFSEALARTPMTLEPGQTAYLEALLQGAAARFQGARERWESHEAAALRELAGEAARSLWHDAAQRLEDLERYAADRKYFWVDVLGQQFRDHHLAGLSRLATTLAAPAGETAPQRPGSPAARWRWAEGWRRVEHHRTIAAAARRRVRSGCEEHLDSRAVRALEEGEPLGEAQRQWLRDLLRESTADGRSEGSDPAAGAPGSGRPAPPAYGTRDALLEELAARDAALAVLSAHHLLACDLLDAVREPRDAASDGGRPSSGAVVAGGKAGGEGAADIAAALRAADRIAAVVHQGELHNRPRPTGGAVEESPAGPAAAEGGAEIHGVAPLVPMALADWLLVVIGRRGYLVPADDPGVHADEVGCIGLIGAGIRRLRFDGCEVPAERIVDLSGCVGDGAGSEPAAGEPFADLVTVAVRDHLAIVRGAGEYLLERSRDHAASRVQFPDTFQDEAGHDSIAKFGAVKGMLAEMEAQRVLLEALTLIEPAGDPWVGAAVRKVAAADAFGPVEGSFGYNVGQVFGGTAYSEDDVIAKYYRDSAPFRFLLAHDDALRVEIGARGMAAVRRGGRLVPVSDDERVWLEDWRDQGPLGDLVRRWEAACDVVEEWAVGVAESLAGGEAAHGPLLHVAGEAVVRGLGAKVCILRAAWRLDAGLPCEAVLEATRLLVDRWNAEAAGLVDVAVSLPETVAVGEETLENGDFEPAPEVPDAEPYEQIVTGSRAAESGDWLVQPFDALGPRYVPEVLWNDEALRDFRTGLEAELRRKFVDRSFDGLTYNRHLEKLHTIPPDDLDYLRESGFLRMPIPDEHGGEEALKATYYIVCEMTGRYGDAALSLVIMANTSIGTTPMLLGLHQDLPRARAELEKVRDDPAWLGEIRERLDRLIGGLARPDLRALQKEFLELVEVVQARIVRSSVLKYIGGGFLRAFFAAAQAGEQRDLDVFGEHLREARRLLGLILDGVDERLAEYPRRQRAHELFLKLISAGYISAFALTEPTAGSDSGGVKTNAKLKRRRVFEDDDGVLHFFLDEEGREGRRNLLDADRLEFDYERQRVLYRWSDGAEPTEVRHDEYDYEKDRPGHWRTYDHGGRKVDFTDIAQVRTDDGGQRWYEFFELNGAKMWITNGRFAQCFAFYARTEPEGVTGFMVDRHAEGLTVGADEEKLGQRGSPTNELSLTAVRVPRECIIGFRGRGQVNALETLNTGRAGLAVTTGATLQEMVEDAVPYLRRRQRPARPLERYWMGRLTEELLVTVSVSKELIGLLDSAATKSVRMESAIGKYYGSEAEHDGIDWMERLRGLEGQTHLHRIEKTRRDARVLNIYEGTNEVQRFLLLRDLVGRVLPAWKQAHEGGAGGEAAPRGFAHADLVGRLEQVKRRLADRLDGAVTEFGEGVGTNVALQPCFFRLAEIAGLVKVLDALLYRMEWVASHEVDDAYRQRLLRASRLACGRMLSRIETLERRYTSALAYLQNGRYPPEVQLGFLSLDERGAIAETWGELPEALRPTPQRRALGRDVRIVVMLKPVPVTAPRVRLSDGAFDEALWSIDAVDQRGLQTALALKRHDPDRVEVVAYALAGTPGVEVLRQALARGADDAILVDHAAGNGASPVLHDPAAVSAALVEELERRPADLVICGDVASDTGQGAVPAYLGARLGWMQVGGVEQVSWSAVDGGGAASLQVVAEGWQGQGLDFELPLVLAVSPPEEHLETSFRVDSYVAALEAEIDRRPAPDLSALAVVYGRRAAPSNGGPRQIAATPEAAAEVLLDMAGLAGGGGSLAAQPWEGEVLGFGQQPDDDTPSCLWIAEPLSDPEAAGAAHGGLESAARFAAGVGLPLDVVLPVEASVHAATAAGVVLASIRPRRLFLVRHAGLSRFTWRGHLEWLREFWGMYRGRPEWLLGAAWATSTLARFAGAGAPGVRRSWSWFHVESVANGGAGIRVASGILDGAARAVTSLPRDDGLRVMTFARSVDIDLPGAGADGVLSGDDAGGDRPGDDSARRADDDTTARGDDTQIFAHTFELDYDPDADPVARLLSSLGGGELTLAAADFVVDFGYGAGGREGLEKLAEPLRALLSEELGLPSVMIGGTRKVTQDLEILPMDRQIGQTGVRVRPKVLLALGVSGAPQHIDYIGEGAVILAFNIDPDAPLMKLNEQRPAPLVHPIAGDVWDTVPRFIEAVRRARQESV